MARPEKKIFITGASGFLGKHFILDSAVFNFKIFALTRNRNMLQIDPAYKNVEILEGDICDIEKFRTQLFHCNYFVHIAGEKQIESKMEEVNVKSLKKILFALKDIPGIKILFISSCGVYGIEDFPGDVISETSTCYPNTIYEKTKFEAENILHSFATGNSISYVTLRPSNVIGEFDKSHKLLNLMKSLKKGFFFYTDKDSETNYVYVKYVTAVMLHFINNDRFNNEIYNVNSPLKLKELISVIKSGLTITNKAITIPKWMLYPFVIFNILPEKFQLLNSKKYFALTNKKIYSTDKLKKELIVDEKEFLILGIKNLMSWYKNQNLL